MYNLVEPRCIAALRRVLYSLHHSKFDIRCTIFLNTFFIIQINPLPLPSLKGGIWDI